MRVVVKFQAPLRPALARWYLRLGRTKQERKETYFLFVTEMLARLKGYEGVPPGAVVDRSKEPPVWLWKYTDDLYALYVVRDRIPPVRGWWGRGPARGAAHPLPDPGSDGR